MECVVLLQGVIKFGVWLSQGDVKHRQESLLDTLGTLEQGHAELLTGDGLEDSRE